MERFAVATSTPPFNDIRPSYPPRSTHRDVSFSSYLRPDTHASFDPPPHRLPRRIVVTADDAEISIFDAEKYYNGTTDQKPPPPPSPPLNLDSIGEKCDFPRDSSVSSVDGFGRNYRTGSFHATPTASSEASWNSQSGLLSNPPGSISITMRNLHLDDGKKSPGSPRRWLFRRKCPCSGNKSVDVEEKFSQTRRQISQIPQNFDSNGFSNHRKQSSETDGPSAGTGRVEERFGEMAKLKIMAHHGWAKDEPIVRSPGGLSPELGHRVVASARPFAEASGFSFPILNPPPAATVKPPANSPEDPPRESLEVFIPPLLLATEELLQRRVAAAAPPYTGEIGRRSFTFAASPRRRGEDDVASDSSSDLFEIESFSTGTIGGGASAAMYRRRDSLDELVRFGVGSPLYRRSLDDTSTTVTSVGPFEPSEASVEWSVVTAEGFDRGSLANFSASASEFGETTRFAVPAPLAGGEGGGGKKKGTGGLLSCRWEKAVSVGPHPLKPGPDPLGQGRYPTETGRAAVIARLAANGGGLGHVGRSNSAPFGRASVKR